MTTSSWYRSYFWNMKGNKEYTRYGYEAAAPKFDPKALDVDCTGRHIMITGGNKGLGLSTALQLARRGAVLHLVCRNMQDAKTARAMIVTETGNDKVHLYQLDLAVPLDVMRFCEDFKKSHDQLHVLINNAGCMQHTRELDEFGIEYNFAVNTLAVHLFTTGLMPLLQSCTDSRVVMVSSAGMLTVRLDPVDLSFEKMIPFSGRLAYSQNKRQQVTLTLSYAQNYEKVHFSSMHPGWTDTLAVRTALPQFYEMMKDKLRTVEQGADTIVWLAISKRATTYNSGLFFQDRESVSTHLPLAWTRATLAEESMFFDKLNLIIDMLLQTSEQPSDPSLDSVVDSNTNSEKECLSADHTETVITDQINSQTNKEDKVQLPLMPQNCEHNTFSELFTNTTEEHTEIKCLQSGENDPECMFPDPVSTNSDSEVDVRVDEYQDTGVSELVAVDTTMDTKDVLIKPTEITEVSSITTSLESTKIETLSIESTVS